MKTLFTCSLLLMGMIVSAQKKEEGKLIGIDSLRCSKGFYNMAFELKTGVVRVVTNVPQSTGLGRNLNSIFQLEHGRNDTIYIRPLANKIE